MEYQQIVSNKTSKESNPPILYDSPSLSDNKMNSKSGRNSNKTRYYADEDKYNSERQKAVPENVMLNRKHIICKFHAEGYCKREEYCHFMHSDKK
jgi:hypothetical protein